MARCLARGRCTALTCGIVLISLAAITCVLSYRWNAEFLRWFDDVPLQVDLDLSTSKDYETTFNQTCEISHGAFLLLDEPIDPEDFRAREKEFRDLRGTLTFLKSTTQLGPPILIDGSSLEYRLGRLSFLRVPFVSNGRYDVKLTITGGTENLSRQRMKLVAKYELCGLENLPSQLFCWASIGFATIGGVITLLVLPLVYDRGLYQDSVATKA